MEADCFPGCGHGCELREMKVKMKLRDRVLAGNWGFIWVS